MHYGLIGTELSHSRSPELFDNLFKVNGIKGTYALFELSNIAELPAMLQSNPNLSGFTVTMPFKRDIFPFLDTISEEAKKIGAVNTVKIKIEANGKKTLHGYNTDIIGFDKMLTDYKKENVKAMIFGTGGAADSVKFVLDKYGIDYVVVSRYPQLFMITYQEISVIDIGFFDWFINATPLGMHPSLHECIDIKYSQITKKHICLDLIYNPEETLFLKKCKEQGATTQNGFTMLKEQAKAAFNIFQQ